MRKNNLDVETNKAVSDLRPIQELQDSESAITCLSMDCSPWDKTDFAQVVSKDEAVEFSHQVFFLDQDEVSFLMEESRYQKNKTDKHTIFCFQE